jgi:hypothetical protein
VVSKGEFTKASRFYTASYIYLMTTQRLDLLGELKNYIYKPLEGNETRLIHLLPGQENDGIRLQTFHTTLKPVEECTSERELSRQDLQKTVPTDWLVCKAAPCLLSLKSLNKAIKVWNAHLYSVGGWEQGSNP